MYNDRILNEISEIIDQSPYGISAQQVLQCFEFQRGITQNEVRRGMQRALERGIIKLGNGLLLYNGEKNGS